MTETYVSVMESDLNFRGLGPHNQGRILEGDNCFTEAPHLAAKNLRTSAMQEYKGLGPTLLPGLAVHLSHPNQ